MDQELLSPRSSTASPAVEEIPEAAAAPPLPPAGLTLLQRLFSAYPGSMGLRLGHWATRLGRQAHQPAEFTLVLNDPTALRRLLLGRDPLRFAEAYFTGQIDVEGDFFVALQLRDHLPALTLSWSDRLRLAVRLLAPIPPATDAELRADGVRRHTRAENKAAIGVDPNNIAAGQTLDTAVQ